MIDTPRRTSSEPRERESKERTTRVLPFPGGSALDRDAPPDNIPATEAVLGSLLIQRAPEQQSNMYGRIAEVIEPNDIHVDLLRRIYVAIGQYVDAGRLANPITLQSAFSSEEFVRPGETVHQYLGSLGAHQAVASADAIEFAHAVRNAPFAGK
jgi:replicative DNA helicase